MPITQKKFNEIINLICKANDELNQHKIDIDAKRVTDTTGPAYDRHDPLNSGLKCMRHLDRHWPIPQMKDEPTYQIYIQELKALYFPNTLWSNRFFQSFYSLPTAYTELFVVNDNESTMVKDTYYEAESSLFIDISKITKQLNADFPSDSGEELKYTDDNYLHANPERDHPVDAFFLKCSEIRSVVTYSRLKG